MTNVEIKLAAKQYCMDEDENNLRFLLENNKEVDPQLGYSDLIWLLKIGYEEVIERLITRGRLSEFGVTILIDNIKAEHVNLIDTILSRPHLRLGDRRLQNLIHYRVSLLREPS